MSTFAFDRVDTDLAPDNEDLTLTDYEKKLLKKLLSNPLQFPKEYLTWLPDYIAMSIPEIPISQISGFKQFAAPMTVAKWETLTPKHNEVAFVDVDPDNFGVWFLVYSEDPDITDGHNWRVVGAEPRLSGGRLDNQAGTMGSVTVPRPGVYIGIVNGFATGSDTIAMRHNSTTIVSDLSAHGSSALHGYFSRTAAAGDTFSLVGSGTSGGKSGSFAILPLRVS